MPYITQVARKIIADGGSIETGGELNYAFTREIKKYLANEITSEQLDYAVFSLIKDFVRTHGKSYNTFNTVLGATLGANLEFARRLGQNDVVSNVFADVVEDFYHQVVGPYEDQKIKENGDVY